MSKTIVITGGSSGLGKALALHLAEAGHRVYVTLRTPDDGAFAQQANITVLHMDVCDEAGIAAAARRLETLSAGRGIDVLINNAGIATAGPLEQLSGEALRQQFEVNVFGVLAVCRHFLPLLKKTQGRIINIGSMSCRMAIPFLGAYGASKAAVKQLSWSLRLELKPWNLHVQHFELGNFPSAIWEKNELEAADLDGNAYAEYLHSVRRLMKGRAQSFNPLQLLLEKTRQAIEGRNNRFNTIIGKDAWKRRLLTTLAPYALLEYKMSQLLGLRRA